MKFIKLGMVLVLAIVAIIVVLTSAGYIVSSDDPDETISIEDGFRTFTEEVCVDDENGITCVENSYLQESKDSAPKLTSYIIKETIFVPKYIEIEKIVFEDKKLTGEEKPSPVDRISNDDINVFSSGVRIDIRNAKWREFIDSNSMDPLIDEGTTTIEIKPKSADEIKVGDIIAYDVEGYDYAFVHRVIEIGSDEEGVYFQTKGDNYYKEDPYKVRFSDVEGIVVGILY